MSRFVRLAEHGRTEVRFLVDGRPVVALTGDTLLTALRLNGFILRRSEFDGGYRAGFCLMGACQDCWVTTADGARLRACSTPVTAGMSILTAPERD